MAVKRRKNGTVERGSRLNPTGIRGEGYRQKAERQLAAMLQVEMADGRSASEHLIAKLLDEARHGEPWAMKLALDRILPAVQKVEHAVQGEPRSPRFVPTEAEQEKLQAMAKASGHLH